MIIAQPSYDIKEEADLHYDAPEEEEQEEEQEEEEEVDWQKLQRAWFYQRKGSKSVLGPFPSETMQAKWRASLLDDTLLRRGTIGPFCPLGIWFPGAGVQVRHSQASHHPASFALLPPPLPLTLAVAQRHPPPPRWFGELGARATSPSHERCLSARRGLRQQTSPSAGKRSCASMRSCAPAAATPRATPASRCHHSHPTTTVR